MRGLAYIFILVVFSLFFSSSIGAKPEKKPADYKNKAHAYVDNLKVYKSKLRRVLSMKHKIDSWEQKLKSEDDVLSRVLKEYGEDQVKHRAGFMPPDTFNRKWKSNGQIRKSKDKVVKFHAEIRQYNKFRSGYNALAGELAKFLYKRNPKEVKVLIKDIDLLLLDLQRAIDDKEYTKAVLIASRSTVVTEFGF